MNAAALLFMIGLIVELIGLLIMAKSYVDLRAAFAGNERFRHRLSPRRP